MKRYNVSTHLGEFIITIFSENNAEVSGSRKATQEVFKKINRKPPNKYGNFFGRERAGYNACLEIINNPDKDMIITTIN